MNIIPEITITDAMVASIDAVETVALWDNATTYASGDRVRVDERIYESLQDSNLNQDPTAVSSLWWVDADPSNRSAFRDQKISTQSTRAESLTIELQLGQLANGLVLLNISGGEVIIEVEENSSVIYSETRSLVDDQDVTNAWEYFFTEPRYKTEAVFPSLPIFAGTTLRVTINSTGGTAGLGLIVVGRALNLGETLAGSGTKFTDFSNITFDAFGDYTRVVRDYARDAVFVVSIDPQDNSRINRIIAENRGKIVAAYPDADMEQYGLTIVGFMQEYEPDLAFGRTEVEIEIKGIT